MEKSENQNERSLGKFNENEETDETIYENYSNNEDLVSPKELWSILISQYTTPKPRVLYTKKKARAFKQKFNEK